MEKTFMVFLFVSKIKMKILSIFGHTYHLSEQAHATFYILSICMLVVLARLVNIFNKLKTTPNAIVIVTTLIMWVILSVYVITVGTYSVNCTVVGGCCKWAWLLTLLYSIILFSNIFVLIFTLYTNNNSLSKLSLGKPHTFLKKKLANKKKSHKK